MSITKKAFWNGINEAAVERGIVKDLAEWLKGLPLRSYPRAVADALNNERDKTSRVEAHCRQGERANQNLSLKIQALEEHIATIEAGDVSDSLYQLRKGHKAAIDTLCHRLMLMTREKDAALLVGTRANTNKQRASDAIIKEQGDRIKALEADEVTMRANFREGISKGADQIGDAWAERDAVLTTLRLLVREGDQ